MRRTLIAALALAAPAAAVAAATPPHLSQAVAGAHRSAENRARDQYRHPAETLAFFGLRPGQTVVEIWPGGGYFTEVIAPAIGPKGKVYAATFPPSERTQPSIDRFKAKLASDPVYRNVTVASMGPQGLAGVPDGSADAVYTFRNVHNWMGNGFAPQAFAAFAKALKPGGLLGVEEHRLPESRAQDPKAESGYVKQSEVIRMAEAAGFKLVAQSEINANPKDTADYPKGVWTLPPNYAEGEASKAKYAAIGESDRMTLLFRKG